MDFAENNPDCFIPFEANLQSSDLPKKLDYPFYYEPQPLAIMAAQQLQQKLEQENFKHNFGFGQSERGNAIGKMFGVLVVQNRAGKIGYLAAFSGKLGNKNHHEGFVPPVFDVLEEDGFFRVGEGILNDFNYQIEVIENSDEFVSAVNLLEQKKREQEEKINQFKTWLKAEKQKRDEIRIEKKAVLSQADFEKLNESLVTREEMAKSEDLGEYYRIPCDGRDLNYNKYFEEGEEKQSAFDDYHSHNTHRLNVEEMKALLMKLDLF
jgi:tRNA pseudouridine32 synthase/23S rRNA pseudouridine746 synthase